MTQKTLYPVLDSMKENAYINPEQYQSLYEQSINDPESFWAEQAKQFVSWFQPWKKVTSGDFNDLQIRWFEEAKLNVSYNCLDRHLEKCGDQVAIIWEGDDPSQSKKITYNELHKEVCKFANVLKNCGTKKGDRVCIYMPMIPEAAVAMLACTRIGAIHSVVFGGFSPKSLQDRTLDSDCKIVITADEGVRGGKNIPLKQNADIALENCPNVRNVIVVKRTGNKINWKEGRDVWYHEAIEKADIECEPEIMDAEDPLFILYTSGSTGKPKGVLHTTAGYLVYVAMTHKYIFNYHDGDVYWCTADVGWITGHSYIVYGPLANGATTLMFEGTPNYPDFSRFWQVVDKHQVTIFYTAPTAIRALRREGDDFVKSTSRKSLKLLGTVGEPINPDVWDWYFNVVGEKRCPIVDTWWQTETGGILISPLPGATPLKPGAATKPLFGIDAAIVDNKGQYLEGEAEGHLVIKKPWPGMLRTIYGDFERFKKTYFSIVPGAYFTGDGARRDKDGYLWITGRVDDVINVSGHRLGTAEIESALIEHETVSEAAVVGVPHEVKGQSIYAYVTTKAGISPDDQLKTILVDHVRKVIGPFAKPDAIQWATELPKTRSGKIMRRILRKIANEEFSDLGDTSTLANSNVVELLISGRKM